LRGELLQERLTTFCYLYRGFHVATPQTGQRLATRGRRAAFNVELRDIEMQDRRSRPRALPRNDGSPFPRRRASHGLARVA
jgi:hypothetical protein